MLYFLLASSVMVRPQLREKLENLAVSFFRQHGEFAVLDYIKEVSRADYDLYITLRPSWITAIKEGKSPDYRAPE